MSGTLYVVATPIGNLEDLSARAIRVLSEVAMVAAEDTRRTRGLLTHLGAHPRLVSYHAHSDDGRTADILAMLADCGDVALVSDAGTPLISDPGADLVTRVRAAGHAIVPIAGPSAPALALSGSGLGGDRYLFLGFMPRRGTARAHLIDVAVSQPWSVVLFEAPGRLEALLEDLVAAAGRDRVGAICRELTKLHEEIRTESLGTLLDWVRVAPLRGEVTVVLAGAPPAVAAPVNEAAVRERARAMLTEGTTRRDAVTLLMGEFELARNQAYRIVVESARE